MIKAMGESYELIKKVGSEPELVSSVSDCLDGLYYNGVWVAKTGIRICYQRREKT